VQTRRLRDRVRDAPTLDDKLHALPEWIEAEVLDCHNPSGRRAAIAETAMQMRRTAEAAARFQAADPGGKPVLLRLDLEAGHGVGSPANQRDALWADIRAFLLWQMGKAGTLP
jgi:hypothetical protein